MNTDQIDKELLLSMLESADCGIIATDIKGVIFYVNQPAEALAGMKANDMTGAYLRNTISFSDGIKNENIRIPSPRSLTRQRKSLQLGIVTLINPSGGKSIVYATFTAIKGGFGKLHGMILSIRNIDRKTLLSMSGEKEHTDAISKLAGSMGADFSNWLSVISNHASAITDSVLPNTTAHNEALRIIQAAEYASGLTNRLLNIARAHGKDEKIDKSVYADPGLCVEKAVNQLEETFADKKITIKTQNLSDLPYIVGEEKLLIDCLISIFLNSLEAMPNGGTITVDTAEKKSDDKEYFVLRVRDTGVGMDKEILEKIFYPLFSTKRDPSSLGLGLTIVHIFLQRWEGFIKVRSQPKQGTSIRLFLKKSDKTRPKSGMGDEKRGGETILLADDKDKILKDAGKALEKSGYKVILAKTAEECRSLASKQGNDIHLFVIDAFLPKKGDGNLLEHIFGPNHSAAVIATSGFSRDFVRGHLKHGPWGFLQKPFDNQTLLGTVRRFLDQRYTQETSSTVAS